MAKRQLRGPGKSGSVKGVKKNLQKTGGGNRLISSVPQDKSVIVRFLTEPEDWYGYFEVYDEEEKEFYPLLADDTEGKKGESPSFRYLANVVITDSEYESDIGKCVPFRLPKSLANQLILKYEKFETLMDRDYDLTRAGKGFDTVYDATPEAPSKFNFKKHELHDLEETLLKAYDLVWGDGDEEDEDDEPEEKPARKKASSRRRKKAEPEPDEGEDDEEYDDEEDEEDEEEEEVKPAPKKRASRKRQPEPEPEEDEDEEEEDEDDEDDDLDDDEEFYTEDELLAMKPAELRELADDYGIELTAAQKKSRRKMADAILAAGEE